MNDLETVVRQAKAGSEQGFQDLYEATRKTALAVIKRYCDETRDYEDILQETYIKVYQSIGTLQDDTKAQAWVNKIAANTAIRHNMKKKPKLFTEMADEEGQLPEFEDDNIAVNPELIADRKAVSEIVLEVMKEIPEDQRDALWMVYGQHVTIREMAESLGVSENTIKSRLFQGKKKLAEKKELFKKLGIDLRLVPVAALIDLAFEDTTYAVAGATLSSAMLAGTQGTAAGSAASAGASASAAGTAAGAGTAISVASGMAAGAGSAAATGAAASAGTAATVGMSLGAKIGIAAVVAAAAIGGGTAVSHQLSERQDTRTVVSLETEEPEETSVETAEQETEAVNEDSYDNEVNRSAVAAYRDMITSNSWLPDSITLNSNSTLSFSLVDLNDDKLYEAFVYYGGEAYVDMLYELLYYQDGQVHQLSLEGQKGAISVYPGQAHFVAYHEEYNVEIAGKVYDFSDGSPKEAEAFSYSIADSTEKRTEAVRTRITELLQTASHNVFVAASNENIEAYLSGSGKATPLEETSGELAESLSGVFESIDYAAGGSADMQPADMSGTNYPAITRVNTSEQLDRGQLESNVISVIRKMYRQTNAEAVQRNNTNWYVPVGTEDTYQMVKTVDDNSGFDELMQANGYSKYRVEMYFDNPHVTASDGGSAVVNAAGPNFIYAVIDGKEYRYYFADGSFVRRIGPDGVVQNYPEINDFVYDLYAAGSDRYRFEEVSYDSRRFYSDLTNIMDNGSSLTFTALAFDNSGTLPEAELNRTYHLTIDADTVLNTETDSIRGDKLYQEGDSAYSFMKRYLLEGEPTVTGYIPPLDCFELRITGEHVDAVDGIWATH